MNADVYRVHRQSYQLDKTVDDEHARETLVAVYFQEQTVSQTFFSEENNVEIFRLVSTQQILEKKLNLGQNR